MTVNEVNDIVSLETPNEIKISNGFKKMLGFGNKGQFTANQTYEGEISLDFAVIETLYIHLKQLNTSHNYFNGTPSSVLSVIPVPNKVFGDIVLVRFEHPVYELLTSDAITELTLEVRDGNNILIDNHRLPISAVLEIL